MYLVAGLGNPGGEYEGTRHNVGFDVIDYLSDKLGFQVNKIKFKGSVGEYIVKGDKVLFLKPSTFMNLSGESIREAADFYKIPVENIIVVYDDVAIDVGRLRVRPSGSDGGHNGMKSIIYQLSSDKFPRVRVGIGASKGDMISHVLGKFSQEERKLIDEVIKAAADAVMEIIENGVQSAMNKYNSFKVSQE
ncbi:aminoacyl-tRNA hydrolase [Fonticella tunisiensis]|uniref:Peptidyl-tRNA hydrolase n=1 Tax=Fonticella tunisiensis TaxID=1096341 RepID=A0A4R7KTL4_9CLOT|nr:aminoacyl-tRNA hydrolase [Fonticella tunisiensis]TDT63457.1 PTH1 family peptidyl-tRNA hydrolase [Fonticella tunisiensis]